MNLLSEHNRILRVGEGGSQEYFAGPNINITDHVISGKYWDNEINSAISSTSGDIVNEAFNQSTAWTEEQGYLTAHQDVSNLPYVQNSALGYNGNLISSISGDGLFAESANNSYHADDADHATYADSATHADSADFVATANFANSASSALNAEVANVAYTALTAQYLDGGWEHDEDGFITAYNNSAFAGGGAGGRYEGILPIVVNNEEMRISAQSAVLGVQSPLYFVEDSETATVIGIDSGAFPTFEGTPDGKISAINGSALNADPVVDYSAGNNIDITDHVISVTGSVPSADRADYAVSATSSHFSHSAIEAGSAGSAGSATYDNLGREITATYLTAVTGDNTPYSAGANIDITNHVVSGKDWTTEIQAASANAVAQIPTGLMVTSGLEYDPDNHYITAYNGSAIGKEATEYSAGPNIVINNHIIGLDTAVELTNITGNRGVILDPSGLYVSNLQQTTYTEIGKDHVFSTDGSASIGWQLGNKAISISDNSGNGDYRNLLLDLNDVLLEERHQEPTPDKVYSLTGACTSAISAINMINSGDNQEYSAGANIDITDHVISGKDWGSDISAASSYAYDQATAQIPTELTGAYVPLSARACTIGSANTAVGEALAQGTNNSADGDAFAQGIENSAKWSIAQGYRNIAETRSIAQGTENTANIDGFAQGDGNSAYDRAIAQGYNNTASTYALAQGYNNTASNESMAQGQQNSAYTNSFAQGFNNFANTDSFAQGSTNLAKENSIAQGYGNSAYNGSQALGYKNVMSGHGMAIGQYNKTSADAYFVVGNGSAETARSDAFIIFKDGSVSAKGDISANNILNGPYVQNTALNIDNGSITSISSYNVGHPQVPVSGESGIYLTKKSGTVYIGYSGAGGGGQGVDYTGIAPIVVNNVEHKISAQSAVLGVQEPLYFVEDSESATIIGFSGDGSLDPTSAARIIEMYNILTAYSAHWALI